MSQNLQYFAKFQNFQLENLVDFEKCCKTGSCGPVTRKLAESGLDSLEKDSRRSKAHINHTS